MHPIHAMPGLIAAARFVGGGDELAAGHNIFDFSGETVVTRVVPAGMTNLLVDMWGGSGAMGNSGGFRYGGGGGWTHLNIEVQEGDVVEIWTGEGGGQGLSTEGGEGGWPDGGDGGRRSTQAGGGGGSSRVYINGILVAIAGGGAGENGSSGTQGSGGDGGGATPNIHSGTNDGQMTAATQTAAGTNTVDTPARDGAAFQGGNGFPSGGDRFTSQGGSGAGSGGGGGGLYGGAAGSERGGGGGSGWVLPIGGDSNSPLDREVYEASTATGVSNTGIGRQAQGWERFLGYGIQEGDATSGGNLGNAQHHGRVSVWAFGPGSDAPLGRLPPNIPAELTEGAGYVNRYEFRQYVCPCDMVIDEIGYMTSNTNDSNSAVASSITIPNGRMLLYNDAGLANSPGACMSRSANVTTLNDGENWFALQQPYAARRGEILWVGTTFGASVTRSLDRIVLASGQSRRGSSGASQAISELWGVTMTARTEAYPVAGRGYYQDINDAMSDVVIAVVPFTNPTSAGSIDVTDVLLGTRIPKGVVIVGGYAPPNTANTAAINVGSGVASRATEQQWCMSANLADNVSLSDGRSDQRTDSIISMMTPGTSVGGGGQTMRATVSAWIAGGVTLNFTVAEATQRQFFAILFAGEDLDCVATKKTDWPLGVTPQDRFGFPPDAIIWTGEYSDGGNGDGDQIASGYSFGLGVAAGADQGCIWQRQNDVQSLSGAPVGGASNTVIEAQQILNGTTISRTITVQGYDADGFEVNVATAAASGTDTHYLALRTRGGLSVSLIDFTTPTSTGVQNVTGAGFQPKAALLLGHSAQAWDTGYYDTEEASGMGIAAFDVNGGVCLSFCAGIGDSNSANSDCQSSSHDNEFNIGRKNSAEALNADWDGFTSDGFDLDWQAVHSSACRGLALCFGW